MKKLVIVLAAVLLALAAGLGVVLFLALNNDIDFGISGTAKLVNTQSFPGSSVESIDISYSSDRLTIEVGDGDTIVLEEYMTSSRDDMLARISQNGTHLQIENGKRNIGMFWYSYAILRLPASWQGDLVAGTSSGSIRCEDTLRLASFNASATSGSVRMANIETVDDVSLIASSGSVSSKVVTAGASATFKATSGSVRPGVVNASQIITATASSGSISFEEAVAAEVTMESSSGSIRVGRLEGKFSLSNSSGGIRVEEAKGYGNATTSSGSVRVALYEITGDVALKSTSGSTRLTVPESMSFTLQADTSSGSIKTFFDNTLTFNSKGNSATGAYGSNPQYGVSLSASSGSVRVEALD